MKPRRSSISATWSRSRRVETKGISYKPRFPVPHQRENSSPSAVPAAARRGARLQAMAIDAMTLRLARSYEDAGIPVLPLKGPRLARALYDDAGLRASSDVDLLVAAAELGRAVRLARAEGFEEGGDH